MQDVSRLVVSTHLFPWKNRNGSAWMGLDYYSFFHLWGACFRVLMEGKAQRLVGCVGVAKFTCATRVERHQAQC
jgi:hypothetical protein